MCVLVSIFVCMHVDVHVHVPTAVCMQDLYLYVCRCVYMYVCMCVILNICKYVRCVYSIDEYLLQLYHFTSTFAINMKGSNT